MLISPCWSPIGSGRSTGERPSTLAPLARGRRGLRQPLVVGSVVLPELGRLPLFPPRRILSVPLDGQPNPVCELDLRLPAKRAQTPKIHGVAVVVPRAVLHKMFERAGLAAKLKDCIGHLYPTGPPADPDVVNTPRISLPQHSRDRADMVVNVQIIPHRRAVAIDWEWKIVERVGDEQWNDLLRKLVGAVGIGSPRDQRRQPEARVIRIDERVAADLTCGVGAARREAVLLAASPFLDMPVDLIRTDLQVALMTVFAGGLQQDVRPVDIGLHEGARVEQGPVDMGLGGEVDSGVRVAGYRVDGVGFADITLDEPHPRVIPSFPKVLFAPGVGELVKDGDFDLRVAAEPVADALRPDEAGAAGPQHPVEAGPSHMRTG